MLGSEACAALARPAREFATTAMRSKPNASTNQNVPFSLWTPRICVWIRRTTPSVQLHVEQNSIVLARPQAKRGPNPVPGEHIGNIHPNGQGVMRFTFTRAFLPGNGGKVARPAGSRFQQC